MVNNQLSAEDLVLIEVQDKPELSFVINISTNNVIEGKTIEPACTIKISEQGFEQLINRETTFEKLVYQNQIKIWGRHQKLREFGISVRARTPDDSGNSAK